MTATAVHIPQRTSAPWSEASQQLDRLVTDAFRLHDDHGTGTCPVCHTRFPCPVLVRADLNRSLLT